MLSDKSGGTARADRPGSSSASNAVTPARIDLWLWRLDADDAETARLTALLSEDEIARARRFVFPIHARRFVCGRARMRQILEDYVGAPAARLAFTYGAQGKPTLVASSSRQIHFNLSHSGDVAALAVSHECALGVDVEQVRPISEDVAGRFFSPAERAALAALPPGARERGFFHCWTRKEAMVKALGGGLSIALDSFDVTLAPGEAARLERLAGCPDASDRWSLLHFEATLDCVGAVAVPMRQCALVLKSSISG